MTYGLRISASVYIAIYTILLWKRKVDIHLIKIRHDIIAYEPRPLIDEYHCYTTCWCSEVSGNIEMIFIDCMDMVHYITCIISCRILMRCISTFCFHSNMHMVYILLYISIIIIVISPSQVMLLIYKPEGEGL